MTDTVILNVAGTLFYAFKSTLIKSEYFNKMFAFENNPQIPIFIDCDPKDLNIFWNICVLGIYRIPTHFKYLAPYFIIDDSAFVSDDKIISRTYGRYFADRTIGSVYGKTW